MLPQKLAQLDPKIIEHVFNEVTDCSGGITWDDIAGQEAAKRLVQEMVVWPMLNPQLFTVRLVTVLRWRRGTTLLSWSGLSVLCLGLCRCGG